MRRLVLLLTLLCAYAHAASYTTVSATLQDSSTQVWANATWTTSFAKPAGSFSTFNNQGTAITNTQTGTADGSGHFSVVLDDNLVVSPGGSGWSFTICPNASVVACNTIVLTITGGSEDVSSQLNAILTVPVVNAAPIIARAYNDTEANGSYGALYINSISNSIRICNSLQCTGSGWVAVSSGALANPLTMNNSGAGAASGTTFDGSVARTLSYNTLGAAPLNSPTFTGVPAAPTASPGTNTTQLATTAFVIANAGGGGNVSNSGTPTIHQTSVWVDATHILGVGPGSSGTCYMSNGASSDPSFQTCPSSGGSGFPTQAGNAHSLVMSNSATLGTGNTFPDTWSHLGGTFSVNSNVAGTATPPNYILKTNTGTAGGSASVSEDAVAQQWNFGIWQAYTCYCATDQASNHISWFGYSSVLYGSLVLDNPNGTVWGFRYGGDVDTNFQAYVGTATGTFTIVDTGVAVPLTVTFFRFGMNKNSLGGIDYYINGTKVATITNAATGFPLANTNVYMVTESGLLANGADEAVYFQSVRGYYLP